jgi:hypothetical protein
MNMTESISKPTRIFLDYRRDEVGMANKLYERLVSYFGADQIINVNDMYSAYITRKREREEDLALADEVDIVQKGEEDLAQTIIDTFQTCRVMLVYIGAQWINLGSDELNDGDGGLWIEIMLARDRIPIISVLAADVTLPSKKDLPYELHRLTRYYPLRFDSNNFESDVKKLLANPDAFLITARSTNPTAPSKPPGPHQ